MGCKGNGPRNRQNAAAGVSPVGQGLNKIIPQGALAGDVTALRLCWDRIVPARKDRPVTFALPNLERASDAVMASAAIVEAVAHGDLTPSEAAELSKVIDGFARALEAADFEERLSRLEQRVSK